VTTTPQTITDNAHGFLVLQQILDHATAVVYVKDRDGRYLFANRWFLKLFARREADVIGHTDAELFPEAIVGELRRNDAAVFERNAPVEFEEQVPQDDGVHTYISLKFPLRDSRGDTYAVCGISTDITARKRTEEVLRQSALGVSGAGGDIFTALVSYCANALGVDYAYIVLPCADNPERLRTLALYAHGQIADNVEYHIAGTPCANVVGQQFRFYPRDVRQLFPGDNMLSQLGIEGYAAYPLTDSQGRALGLIGVMHRQPLADDRLAESMLKIFAARAAAELERERANEALRASEEQYHTIFNGSVDGLALCTPDGRIVDTNPAFCRLHGYTREELLAAESFQFVHSDSHLRCWAFFEAASQGHSLKSEARARRKDGTLFDAEVHGVPVHYGDEPHLLLIMRDITERKRAEQDRTRLEAQLRQAQKMEAIGHLTGGVAHDFNNILTAVMGYVAMAQENVATLGDAKLEMYLQRALRSGNQARDLIQQMLTFSRGQRGEPRALQLAPIVKESVKLMRSTLPSSIEFDTDLDTTSPSVLLDPVQLEQVLMNLCINARDAMDGAGQLRVTLGKTSYRDAVCTSCRQPVRGTFVELAVSDSGSGIAPEVVDRMFEPFFTTKETGKGSGMGLSTVHGIVHEHGGHIVAESQPGAGATFRVLLRPMSGAAGEAGIAEAEPAGTTDVRRLTGRVLVVDDEPAVGEFMAELLGSWGLDVTVKNNGVEAEAFVAADSGKIDLVVTDQTMPKMTGIELAQRLTARHHGLPVILYTGYAERLTEAQTRRAGIHALVTKPIDTGAFFRLVQETLQ
jgi:two-component system cell cycle sensor histidine kinase/response regulator CckA